MNLESKIWIAGHTGMVGSSIVRHLQQIGCHNLVFRTSKQLDLRCSSSVNEFYQEEKPEYVFLAAAKVGGILANSTYKADFIFDNLSIELNVINGAYRYDVKKLLFLGSSCIYPAIVKQPMPESALLSGKLETTNEPYAIAKIAGIKLCQAYREQYGCDFISIMPSNLYGPNDNYNLQSSHVLPALLAKFHKAKVNNSSSVEVWGSGIPKREFLHVDDLAEASVYLMQNYSEHDTINVGTGMDISVNSLAEMIKSIVGYTGQLNYDLSKPDGTLRKLLDVSKINSLGWKHKIGLEEGIRKVYSQALNEDVL